jgi:hypothetical protein
MNDSCLRLMQLIAVTLARSKAQVTVRRKIGEKICPLLPIFAHFCPLLPIMETSVWKKCLPFWKHHFGKKKKFSFWKQHFVKIFFLKTHLGG